SACVVGSTFPVSPARPTAPCERTTMERHEARQEEGATMSGKWTIPGEVEVHGLPPNVNETAVEDDAEVEAHGSNPQTNETVVEKDRKSTRLNSSHVKISYA